MIITYTVDTITENKAGRTARLKPKSHVGSPFTPTWEMLSVNVPPEQELHPEDEVTVEITWP